jgi:aryl-alcohol dehydrogenase-like predicted oxidoreductase
MRYRPFGRSGLALSSIGLRLSWEGVRHNQNLASKLIMAALENGINTYHFDSTHPELLKVAAETFSLVERRLLFISVAGHEEGSPNPRSEYELTPLRERLKAVIREAELGWVDVLMCHAEAFDFIPDNAWAFIDALKSSGMLKFMGASANTDRIKAIIDHGGFSILATAFDIDTSWDKRHLLDEAVSKNMGLFGHSYYPHAYRKASDVVPKAARKSWLWGKAADPLAGSGTYAFLHQTPDWNAEELCLGYALTQASLTTVLIAPNSVDQLEALANTSERYLPSSVPAQIEMARFHIEDKAVMHKYKRG